MTVRRLKLSEIAALISRADGLSEAEADTVHGRVRNVARLGFLQNGEAIDARGTWTYPAHEVHRARILSVLLSMSMDVAHVGPLITRAASEARPADSTVDWPERTRCESGHQWRGFADIVEGVALGEPWTLRLRHYSPGYQNGSRLTAVFLCGEDSHDANDPIFGSAPLATLSLDLARLFAGLDAA